MYPVAEKCKKKRTIATDDGAQDLSCHVEVARRLDERPKVPWREKGRRRGVGMTQREAVGGER